MTTYAITGANGHTGQIVANTLLDHGHQVRVVGRHAEKLEPFVARGAQAFVGTLDDVDLLTRAFSGADAVYVLLPGSYGEPDFRAYQNRLGEAIATGYPRCQGAPCGQPQQCGRPPAGTHGRCAGSP